MLLDYFLTILGAKSARRVYSNHFKVVSYELNPLWKNSVERLRWFNLRHLVIVCLVTLLAVFVDVLEAAPSRTFDILFGILLGGFGLVCCRHLNNLLLFGYLNRHPAEISGQVTLSMPLQLRISLLQYLSLAPLLLIIGLFTRSTFVFGVCLGVGALVIAHLVWSRRWSRKMRLAVSRPAKTTDPQLGSVGEFAREGTES